MPQTRIAFADTNWLFSLYYQTRDRPAIAAWAEKGTATIVVSAAVLAECRCNFWRAGDRLMALDSDSESAALSGLWLYIRGDGVHGWRSISQVCATLERRHFGNAAYCGGAAVRLSMVSQFRFRQRL